MSDSATPGVATPPTGIAGDAIRRQAFRRIPAQDVRPVTGLHPVDDEPRGTVVAAYPLGPDATMMVEQPADARAEGIYRCVVRRRDEENAWRRVDEGDGAAEALVDLLRHHASPPVEGFRVVRLTPPREASGERVMDTGEDDATAVAVGERVVVRWQHVLTDAPHPGPVTLQHLSDLQFQGVPTTHGMLLWTAPSGREVPCAVAHGYLPSARDARAWLLELVQEQLGLTGGNPRPDPWLREAPARLGRFAASVHAALARPSSVLPDPFQHVGADVVMVWHVAIRRRLEAALEAVGAGRLDWAAPEAVQVLAPRAEALARAVDGLYEVAQDRNGVIVQRVHGDLHLGQILRWAGGLAVTDFDGVPGGGVGLDESGLPPALGGSPQGPCTGVLLPAAWDVARLRRSIDRVARVADRLATVEISDEIDAWSATAQKDFLDAYVEELAATGSAHLLDERLLAAFEVDQACRGLLDAVDGTEPLPGRTAAIVAALALNHQPS